MSSHQPLQSFLVDDERVLWSGQPKQGLIFSGRDTFLVPFSLLWGGFAIFWNVMVWLPPLGNSGEGADWFFKIWGLPFLLVGLYIMFGRFVHDAHIRKTMFYAATDRHIVVMRGSKMTSLDIDRLPRLELSEYRDGTGTLAFESSNMLWGGMNGFGLWVPAMDGAVQFFRIQQPRSVYELIRKQVQS